MASLFPPSVELKGANISQQSSDLFSAHIYSRDQWSFVSGQIDFRDVLLLKLPKSTSPQHQAGVRSWEGHQPGH